MTERFWGADEDVIFVARLGEESVKALRASAARGKRSIDIEEVEPVTYGEARIKLGFKDMSGRVG